MSVEGRLNALDSYVREEDPFARIKGQVFLDAQPAIQWARLGILEKVFRLLPDDDEEPRFRIQDRAFRETVGVISNQFSTMSAYNTAEYLRARPNLLIGDPIPSSTPFGIRILELQDRCFIEAGEDPADYSPKRHLGEAETLAVIEMFASDAVFVTADKGAIATAESAEIGRPVSPFAFAGGVIRTLEDVTGFWEFACYGRQCVIENEWYPDCIEILECNDLTDEAAERSPIHPKILRAEDGLKWMLQDLRGMLSLL